LGKKSGTSEFLIYDFEEILNAAKKANGGEFNIQPEKALSFPHKYSQVHCF